MSDLNKLGHGRSTRCNCAQGETIIAVELTETPALSAIEAAKAR